MSTPSGKPSYPIELSDYLARKPRERDEAEPDPVESGHDTFRSPYAPKSARLHSEPAPNTPKRDLTGGASDYAPKRAQPHAAAAGAGQRSSDPAHHDEHPPGDERASPADGQSDGIAQQATGHEAPLCPDAVGARHPAAPPAGSNASPDQSQTGGDGSTATRVLDPDPAISLQPRAGTHDRQSPQAGGDGGQANIDDRDLDRLENSVRWLQRRHAAAMRLPRAHGLSLPPLRSTVGGESREPEVDAMRSPLRSLEPTRLTPPPSGGRHSNALLALAVLCTFMAGAVVYLLLTSRSPPSQATSTHISSVRSRPTTPRVEKEARAQLEQRSVPAADAEPPAEAAQPTLAAATPSAIPEQQEKAAMPQPAPAGAQSPPAGQPARTLDPQEISLLVNQGEKHLAVGDLAAARTVFQRAAQAGNAAAALALAATYDPNVPAKLQVLGMGASADPEKARTWYRTAEALGSAEATLRLQSLDKQ